MYRLFPRIKKSILWPGLVILLVISGCQPGSPDAGPASSGSDDSALTYAPAIVEQAAKPDSSTWPVAQGTVDGVSYSYKYPAGWSADLTYCAPGAAEAGRGEQHLPKGCVSTDFLVGQKAGDVGRIQGDTLDLGGKSAVRLVDGAPLNGLVSRVYTLMVYGDDGQPEFGLVTMVGPDTDKALQDEVTAKMDAVAATLRVEKQR